MKFQLTLALTGALLSSGCVLAPSPYPYAEETVYAPGRTVIAPEPVEIYEPRVIIVENGIRHDRYYYQCHPEFYHRDRIRYPERFRHDPYGSPRFRPALPASHGSYGDRRHKYALPGDANQQFQQELLKKYERKVNKKKHHDHDDRD
jgi:hypothetical protein